MLARRSGSGWIDGGGAQTWKRVERTTVGVDSVVQVGWSAPGVAGVADIAQHVARQHHVTDGEALAPVVQVGVVVACQGGPQHPHPAPTQPAFAYGADHAAGGAADRRAARGEGVEPFMRAVGTPGRAPGVGNVIHLDAGDRHGQGAWRRHATDLPGHPHRCQEGLLPCPPARGGERGQQTQRRQQPTGGGSVVAALFRRIHRRSLTRAPARSRQAAGTESESASRGFAARRGLLAGIACSGVESMVRRTLRRALLLGLLALPIAVPGAAADLLLRGEFSGARVVSATESDATGEASAVLADDNDLLVDLVYAGLANGATG